MTEYTVKDGAPTQAQIDKADKRRMDCIDCHNRPSHIYVPPDLRWTERSAGAPSMPRCRSSSSRGSQVLTADYKTSDEAQKAIADNITKFYQDKYPQIASAKADSIKGAVAELQRIYSTTFFPDMKVNWKTHPNNIGHMYYPGLLPLPRWQPRQQGRQGHQQGLQLLPYRAGAAGKRHADRRAASPALQASG